MLQLTDVAVSYEGVTLFGGVTFHAAVGESVALVGANGAGKSSLLRIAAGLQERSAGSVTLLSGRTVAYLPQDGYIATDRTLHDEMVSVFADVLAAEERQRELERRMAGLAGEELQGVLEEYASAQADFDRLGGYTVEREVGAVLHGLGFAPKDYGRPVAQLSGGWRSRVALGKALLRKPDLLLLDEPTNHLDLATMEWLEDYLAKYPGAIVVVSHDRYFLERVTRRTLEIERGRLTDYPGPYSWYVAEKARRREQQQAQHDRQQREIERQQVFIDRFRAKATKASAVKSREKAVARIERVEAPQHDPRGVSFRFTFSGQSGRDVYAVRRLRRAYGARVVLDGLDLLVERGDKIAVVGPNGVGKSTLLKTLAGLERPDAGSVSPGHNLRVSYFAQHQAELLESDHTVWEEVLAVAPTGWTVTQLRTLLGRFLFSGDDIEKPVGVLSGGERSRVALVRMLLAPANTLLLDEPTNHLDIATRDVLESALRGFEGTALVISHDRYFLDRFATKTLELEPGRATLFPGNYSEYRERKWRAQEATATVREPVSGPASVPQRADESRPMRRPPERELRKRRAEVRTLEDEVECTEARLGEVQSALADPAVYEQYDRYTALLREFGELQGRVEELTARWERHAQELEALEPPEESVSPSGSDEGRPGSEPGRERLLERLSELEAMLEDPSVLGDERRSRAVADEYASVHESLAAGPASAPSSTPHTAEDGDGVSPESGEAARLRFRLAEVEALLADPDVFLDESRSASIIEEYGDLQHRMRGVATGR